MSRHVTEEETQVANKHMKNEMIFIPLCILSLSSVYMALHWPVEMRNLPVPSVCAPTLWRGGTIRSDSLGDCVLFRMTVAHPPRFCSYERWMELWAALWSPVSVPKYKIWVLGATLLLGGLSTERPFSTLQTTASKPTQLTANSPLPFALLPSISETWLSLWEAQDERNWRGA